MIDEHRSITLVFVASVDGRKYSDRDLVAGQTTPEAQVRPAAGNAV